MFTLTFSFILYIRDSHCPFVVGPHFMYYTYLLRSVLVLACPVYFLKGICVCVVCVLVFRGSQTMRILSNYCFPLKKKFKKDHYFKTDWYIPFIKEVTTISVNKPTN